MKQLMLSLRNQHHIFSLIFLQLISHEMIKIWIKDVSQHLIKFEISEGVVIRQLLDCDMLYKGLK